jgi:nitroreductase
VPGHAGIFTALVLRFEKPPQSPKVGTVRPGITPARGHSCPQQRPIRNNIMNTTEIEKLAIIFGRRSVRLYTPGDIRPETVTTLLEAAMAAPSAMTKDPWRFVVLREPQSLAALAAALPGGKMLSTAALSIVVCGDLDAAFERQLSYLLQDCSAAIENLLLCAHGLGLGACWVGVHPSEDAIRRLREMLALPATFVPIAAIALGWPGEALEPRTRYNPDYVRFGKW